MQTRPASVQPSAVSGQLQTASPPEIRIVHHGAVTGVTGSCHELWLDAAHSVLIDCGLFQGAETSGTGASPERPEIDFDLRAARALLVTHGHLDHVGRIPYLLAAGFQGQIYGSEPTAVLLPLMLEDALKVGVTRDPSLVQGFLGELRRRLLPVPYRQWLEVPLAATTGDGSSEAARLSVKFQPAGHILGSAYLECLVEMGMQRMRVLFSGDLGATYSPLLYAPRPPYAADVLVLESTYGDRLHEDRRTRRQRLQQMIERCVRDQGVVLIPAFSIGRTQELLYELEESIHRATTDGHGGTVAPGVRWEDLDIIVDSPLARRFTATYEQLTTIESHQEHLETIAYLKKVRRPAIILAASGMCAGGRIVNYLKAFIGDPTTDILLVGYQAEGTPGRAIQRYGPQHGSVELDGVRYPIHAGVHVLGGYSAHADQRMLLNFVRRMRRKPGEIRLVHGSPEAKAALKARLEVVCPQARVVIPERGAMLMEYGRRAGVGKFKDEHHDARWAVRTIAHDRFNSCT